MQNLTPVQYWLDETERNAYNAAFTNWGCAGTGTARPIAT